LAKAVADGQKAAGSYSLLRSSSSSSSSLFNSVECPRQGDVGVRRKRGDDEDGSVSSCAGAVLSECPSEGDVVVKLKHGNGESDSGLKRLCGRQLFNPHAERGTALYACIALAELPMTNANVFKNFRVISTSLSHGEEIYYSTIEESRESRKLSLWNYKGEKTPLACGFVVLSADNWKSAALQVDLRKWMVDVNPSAMIIHNIVLATVFEYCRRTLLRYLRRVNGDNMLNVFHSLELTKNLTREIDKKTQTPLDYTALGLQNVECLSNHFKTTSFFKNKGKRWTISLDDIHGEYETLLRFPSSTSCKRSVVFDMGV